MQYLRENNRSKNCHQKVIIWFMVIELPWEHRIHCYSWCSLLCDYFPVLVVCIAYMLSNSIYHLTSITRYLHFKSFETNLNRVSCAESYEKWSVHVQSCKENFSFIIYVYSKKMLLYIITNLVLLQLTYLLFL